MSVFRKLSLKLVEEIEDLIAWNLSFGIPIEDTVNDLDYLNENEKKYIIMLYNE